MVLPLASAVNIGVKSQFTLDQIQTVWDGTNAYWIINDSDGKTISYYTFPQVQSQQTTGQHAWQYESPIGMYQNYITPIYSNYTINGTNYSQLIGKNLTQMYLLSSGGALSIILEDRGNGVKFTYGIFGGYDRNYRIDFTSNGVPSNKANLNETKKIFQISNNTEYYYGDIDANYTVTNNVYANKNFHQYIEVGNAYNQWKYIDPTIVASDTVQYSSDAIAYSPYSNSYINIKEITVTDSYTGSWRIKFDLEGSYLDDPDYCGSYPTNGYATLYKNGVAYGTPRGVSNYGYSTFSQNFTSISISSGDKIQIYMRGDTSECVDYAGDVKNFRIEFDTSGGGNPTYIPTRPNISTVTSGIGYVNQSWVVNNTGNITNYYNSSINGGSWVNGSTTTYRNTTGLGSLAWANLTVWSFNSTNGTTSSLTALTNNTQALEQITAVNYSRNVSQSFSISNLVKITKSVASVNYTKNNNQQLTISASVSIFKQVVAVIYNRNVSQQISISNSVGISKYIAGIYYNRSVSQSFSIVNSVGIVKTIAHIDYSRNVAQSFTITNGVVVSKFTADTINIISWGNSNTSNQNLTLTVLKNTNITFNATTNQNISTCSWTGATQINCTTIDTYAWNNFTTAGTKYVSINVSNSNGTAILTWTINVVSTDEFTLNGYINNTLDFPLYGARIDLNSTIHTFTNITGYYEFIDVPENNYSVLARQIGYVNQTKVIYLSNNTMLNFTLLAKSGGGSSMSADDYSPAILLAFLVAIMIFSTFRNNKKEE
jgi:hypothetical protein